MKSVFLTIIPLILATSQSASALDVEVHVHNPCRPEAKQCFQMDVYLNGNLTESWVTSPGDPNNNADFDGSNTPEFVRGEFTSANGAGYKSHRGDPMPYAMHINNTGYAVHGSSLAVDGHKRSHGCMRLKTPNAQKLNAWVKEAFNTNGIKQITVNDTEATYAAAAKSKKKTAPPVAKPVIEEDEKPKTLLDLFKKKKKKKKKPSSGFSFF